MLGEELGCMAFNAAEPMHLDTFGRRAANAHTAWRHVRARDIVHLAIMPDAK